MNAWQGPNDKLLAADLRTCNALERAINAEAERDAALARCAELERALDEAAAGLLEARDAMVEGGWEFGAKHATEALEAARAALSGGGKVGA